MSGKKLAAIRRWVVYAVYKGSSLASGSLVMMVAGIPWRADPKVLVTSKAVEGVAQLCASWGFPRVEALWKRGRTGGPVQAAKQALAQMGIRASFHEWAGKGQVLEEPWMMPAGARRSFLLEQRRRVELHDVTRRRTRCGDLTGVSTRDLALTRKQLGLAVTHEAALVSVQVGDGITNDQAKHFNGGRSLCQCGELDSLEHAWWHCPMTATMRRQACHPFEPDEVFRGLCDATRRMGLPTEHQGAAQWRASREEVPGWADEWKAKELFPKEKITHAVADALPRM